MTLGLGSSTFNGGMIEQFDAWQSEGKIWRYGLGASYSVRNFYGSLIERAVPLKNQVLRALRGSSLALYIYTWPAQRLHRVHNSRGDEISWRSLKEQFGHEYSDDAQGRKDFRKEFESALSDVLRLYPKAKIESNIRNGIDVGSSGLFQPSGVIA